MSKALAGCASYGAAFFSRLSGWQDRPLLANGQRELTALDIAQRVPVIAGHLREAGIGQNDVGLICLRDPIDTVLGFLAHWYLGASPLVLDFRQRAEERARMFQASGARLALVEANSPGRDGFAHLDWSPEFLHAATPTFAPVSTAVAAPAMLLASSGTTGSPKIYAVDYDVMIAWGAIRDADLEMPLGLALCALPLQYVASIMLVLRNLLIGLPVRFHPVLTSQSDLIEAMLSHPVVHTALSPSVIRAMAADVGTRDVPLLENVRSLRSSGGPALPDDKIAAYRNLSSGYNMAFGSGLSGFVSVLAGEDVLLRPETSGRVHSGMHVDVVDPSGRVLPKGTEGALRIHTKTPSRLIAPTQPANEVLGDGWCMTGDVGMVDEDGFLTVLGRSMDMIVRGGISISATELESVIAKLPGVKDVAVIGLDDLELGQEVAAAVVAPSIESAALRQYCISKISPDKRPRKFALVDRLPYSANGKLLRRKIDLSVFD